MAFPSTPVWNYVGFGGSGLFTQIYADPTVANKVWLVSDVAGIYVSTDNGDTWTPSTSGLAYVDGTTMQQAPSDATNFYIATGRAQYTTTGGASVHRSTDSGATWTMLASGVSYKVLLNGHKALAIDRSDKLTAYVGNSSGDSTLGGNIQRTTDGSTWSTWKSSAQVGLGNIHCMVVDMSNTYLWVGSSSGLRRITKSDGTVQTHTLTGTNATQNRDIVACTIAGTNYVFVTAGNRIAYTTDHGSTWNYTATISAINSSNCAHRLAISPGASLAATKMMIGYTTTSSSWNGGRQKSSDGGSTWSTASGSTTYDTAHNPTRTYTTGVNLIFSLTVDPNNSNRFYCCDAWGAYRTDDFGVTWTEKANGNANCVNNDLAVSPNGAWIFTCSMDAGLMRSNDYGSTWSMCIPNSTTGQNYPQVSGHHWRVAVTGTSADWDAGNGHVICTNWPWDSSTKNQILRSTDNGATWSIITGTGIPNATTYGGLWNEGYPRGLAVDPTNNNILWCTLDGLHGTLSNSGGIFKSTDNGLTWTRTTALPSSSTDWASNNKWAVYKGIDVNPTDSNNVIYGTAYQIWRTTNGGTSWSAVSGTSWYTYWLKFGPDGTAYAAVDSTGPKVYRSTDKGATWTRIWSGSPTSGPASGLAVHPTDAGKVCVSILAWASSTSANRIYATENANDPSPTWTDITGNLPNGVAAECAMWCPLEGSAGYIYMARAAGGIYKMSLAEGGGTGGGALTSCNVQPASLVAATTGNLTIDFTTVNDILNNGKIKITLPTSLAGGFTVNSGGTTAEVSQSGFDGTRTVSASGNVITITRTGGTTAAAGAKQIVVSFIKNPTSAGSTGTYQIQTLTSADIVIDENLSVAADTITPAPTVTNVRFSGVKVTGFRMQ